ncbi:cytochrome b561 domain-containing protein 1 [Lates japonicus]|uniref:ascorbate ferrireductase (transmembrane) n=1 Tax=Lates japonicus TaxID=270547 RepID=A0AAD3RD62_LATJO|nr:cytochrome b561 domain-containing protein 1 [Lates japonicus]
MRSDVEYSPVGEGLGMRDFWLYVWLRRAAVIVAHVTGMGLTLIISLLSRPGTSLFSWHPVCMSVAYCLCMTEGILLFSAEGSPFCFKSRKGKVRLHWFCQALVLIASATGLGFMVASKNVSERPHLPLRLSSSLPKLKLYHATCGLVVYLLATVTMVLAMFSDWFQATVKGVAWWAFLVLPFFPALVVMNQITNAYLPRKKLTS